PMPRPSPRLRLRRRPPRRHGHSSRRRNGRARSCRRSAPMSDDVLLVIARVGDPAIPTLRAYAPGRIAHATIADLSRAGWRYAIATPPRLSACAHGRVIRVPDIAGVLCRVGAVTPSDLPHIHEDDRVYVAAEMNAFLHAWLMQYDGVRFNDPSWV